MTAVETNDTDSAMEIEKNIVEVRNLFVQLFGLLVKSDKKQLGMRISPSQIKTLSAFHEDREYKMSELSRNALVKMPSMTEMVDKLQEEGILERLRDPKDRRVVRVRLTAEGKKIHKKFVDRRKREIKILFGELSKKDQSELVHSLKNVSGILKKIQKQ